MSTFEQLRIPTAGSLQLVGGPDSTGRRPFSMLLCVLDKAPPRSPVPTTLSGRTLSLDKQFVMTAEAARSFGPTIIGMPIRVSERATSHKEAKGTPDERMAAVCGQVDNSTVVAFEGDEYWKIDGHLWPQEIPEQVLAEINARPDLFGGSFEVQKRGEWPVDGDTLRIGPFEAQGAALLRRDSAAYQRFTRLLYAEALGVDEIPDDRADDTISHFRTRYDAACEAVAAELMPADSKGGGNPPEEEDNMAQDESMAGLLAEINRQAGRIAVLETELASRDERLAELDTVMAEMGAMSPKDMLAKMKAMLADVQGKLDEMAAGMKVSASALAERDEQITGLQAEVQKGAAETLFGQLAGKYPEDLRPRLHEVCEKQARGETPTPEEFLLLASAATPAPPDATAAPPANGAAVAPPAEADALEAIMAEAQAMVYAGKLVPDLKGDWILQRQRAALLASATAE